MFAAWHLAEKAGDLCRITVFESSDRAGGKILTERFAGAGIYEAGVAEFYDYSRIGPDPLRELMERDLCLPTRRLSGGTCVMDGAILRDIDALAPRYGNATRDAVAAFHASCAHLLTPFDYYNSAPARDNALPWARISAAELLQGAVPDEMARRYLQAMAHCDVAASAHLTSGLNFAKNVLMDVPGYLDCYSIVGGNEELIRALVNVLDVEIQLNAAVESIEVLPDRQIRLGIGTGVTRYSIEADIVILALPLNALGLLQSHGAVLSRAMADHVAYFDRPGHYLRATLLFERPFWRSVIPGSWWMLDACNGVCVYDESSREERSAWGILGFLIAGEPALRLSQSSDASIEALCLDALPGSLAQGRRMLVDRRIHRWPGSVNALPGGWPARGLSENHRLALIDNPGIYLAGDYMFDSTVNGAFDSADAATEMVLADLLKRRRRRATSINIVSDPSHVDAAIAGFALTAKELFAEPFIIDLLNAVWPLRPGGHVLVVGSGAGADVAALRRHGLDTVGIEWDPVAHTKTPIELRPFNLRAELTDLPFDAQAFDVVIERGLCRLAPTAIGPALNAIRAATKRGLVLCSITSDLPIEMIERPDLLADVQTFMSRWEWSDRLMAHGFELALSDSARLAVASRAAATIGIGPGKWFENEQSLLYSFYNVGVPPPRVSAAPEPALVVTGEAG